jgi:tartrate/fumarate subfamily iron-sulfur-dependent hydro-lyase beta chain
MNKIKHLKLPLSEPEARSLKVGEMVTVSGKIFTGRSRFHIRAIENEIVPPIDFTKINTFFHVGPVMRQAENGWELVSIEPTSSIRFERYGADVVRKLKLRTLIGKTTMGPATTKALQEIGGVYLTKIGICGNQLGEQVKNIETVYFLDELGKTEATWVFEVEKFGPFFVGIDSHGNNYFEELSRDIEENMPEINAELGIPDDYDYTNVNSTEAK